jgi:hypothetical protein
MISYIIISLITFMFLFTFHPIYTFRTIKYVYKELRKGNISIIEINLSKGLGFRNKLLCDIEIMNIVEPIELEDQEEDEEEETEFGIVKKRTKYFVTKKIIFYIQPFK